MAQPVIAFIGPGNMTRCLIGGLVADNYPLGQIWVAGPKPEKLRVFAEQFGVNTTTDNAVAVSHAEIVVLAVKPQVIKDVVLNIAAAVQQKKSLIVSIAAGIKMDLINQWLTEPRPIVRCMQNMPAMVGCSATAMIANTLVSDEQQQQAESLMRSVGLTLWVNQEDKLDVVTALSGSGPAYFFLMMEMLQQAGVSLGLDEHEARLLTLQTALGSARMALESDHSASSLRAAVTSPGGTTERALEVLQAGKIENLFNAAIEAAAHRAKELSDQLIKENG